MAVEFKTVLKPALCYTDDGCDEFKSWVAVEFEGKDLEVRFSEYFDEMTIKLESTPLTVKDGFDGIIELILKGEEDQTLRITFWFDAAEKLVGILSKLRREQNKS